MSFKKKPASFLSSIPKKTGVYQYYDVNNNLLYVGKAKNLKGRISSYFSKQQKNQKTQILVAQIYDIKYILVKTELDALFLENNLIKEHKPKYNVLLKDDKTYPWICISNCPLPKVFKTRKIIQDGAEYYGPYISSNVINIYLDFFAEIFYDNGWDPFTYLSKNANPILKKKHLFIISDIRKILKGNIKPVLSYLTKKMKNYSSNLDFENAQKTKDKIQLIKSHQSKSTVVNPKINDVDVFSLINLEKYAYVNYLKIISRAF